MLYKPSITMMILGVCKAVFLSKGLLLCETVGGKSLPRSQESSEVAPSAFVRFPFPQHTTFLVRLRTIAFLLTVMLTAGLFAVCRLNLFETTLTMDWWKCELTIIGIECGRWFLICFLVWLFISNLILAYGTTLRFFCHDNHPCSVKLDSAHLPIPNTVLACSRTDRCDYSTLLKFDHRQSIVNPCPSNRTQVLRDYSLRHDCIRQHTAYFRTDAAYDERSSN
jgi:hypothetical protein